MADVDPEELGELLSAYLDGEVTAEEAAFVERTITEDGHARQLLEELRGTARLVSFLPVHAAPKSIAEDLQFHAERSELLGEPDEGRQIGGPRRLSSWSRVAVAAMLALVVLGGWWFSVGPGARVPREIGTSIVDTFDASKESSLTAVADPLKTPVHRDSVKVTPVAPVPEGNKRVTMLDDRSRRSETPSKLGSRPRERMADSGGRGRGPINGFVLPFKNTAGKKAVIGSADLEHKLATRPVTSLGQHLFESEPLRLRITVKNEAQRDALTARLASRLEQDHVIDRTDWPLIISRESESSENFYYPGQAGRNFDDADQHQLLIRAQAAKIDRVMEELGHIAGVQESVTLVLDYRSISGLDNARRALRGLRVQSEVDDEESRGSGPTAAVAAPPAEPEQNAEVIAEDLAPPQEVLGPILVDRLEEMFGVNLAVFARANEPLPHPPLLNGPESAMPAVAALTEKAAIKQALSEPPGLVESRLRALLKKSATLPTPEASGPATPVSGAGRSDGMRASLDAHAEEQATLPASAERLVTLVVEVSISQSEAAQGEPAKRPQASPKADTKAKTTEPAKN